MDSTDWLLGILLLCVAIGTLGAIFWLCATMGY